MFVRPLAALVAIVSALAPSVATAQPVTQLKTVGTSGTITTNGGAVTMLDTAGMASLLIQTVGTFSLTWELQCAGDGTTFDADDEIPVTLIASTPAAADAITSNAEALYTATIAGCRAVRVIATAFTSGTMTVTLTATPTGGSSGGGGAAGSVSISQGGNTAAVNASSQLSVTCANCGGAGASVVEDVAHVTGDTGAFLLGVRRDTTPTTSATTAGDYTAVNIDALGRLYVQAVLYNSSGVEQTAATDKAEDVAHVTGDTGPVLMTKRTDAAAVSSNADGDYSTLNVDALGLQWTRVLDPCSGVAKQFFPFNISTATTTEITPSLAGASNNYYVCSIVGVTAGANNVAIVDDDTDNCASVTAGMAGGLTAASGLNFAANGGFTFGGGNSAIMKTNGTNRVVCFITSGTTQLSGVLVVVAAP